MARNFRGLKISRSSRINHEPRKFLSSKILPFTYFNHTYCAYAVRGATCQHDLQSFLVYFTQFCFAMALYRYFQASEKSSCKLPNPRGPLSRLIPSSSIVSAYEKVQSVLERSALTVGERDNATPSSLPNWRPKIGRRAAEHVVDATVRLYAKRLPDCWAMGVVTLKVGGASAAWRSSKIKSRKGLSAKIFVRENFCPRNFLAIRVRGTIFSLPVV